jgi:hypothetical protein
VGRRWVAAADRAFPTKESPQGGHGLSPTGATLVQQLNAQELTAGYRGATSTQGLFAFVNNGGIGLTFCDPMSDG